MDAVHPKAFEQEFMVMNTKSEALGLLRLRPDAIAGLATAWVFLHDPALYASSATRRGFKALLREVAKLDSGIRQVRVPTGPKDDALRAFLAAAGFESIGTEREALFRCMDGIVAGVGGDWSADWDDFRRKDSKSA
jgi:hypothetical protein